MLDDRSGVLAHPFDYMLRLAPTHPFEGWKSIFENEKYHYKLFVCLDENE